MMRHARKFCGGSHPGAGWVVALCILIAACDAAEDLPNLKRLLVRGTPGRIGRQVGTESRDFIRSHHPMFLSFAVIGTGQNRAALYARAKALAAKLAPEETEELKGLAAGCGLSYDDVLFLNFFYSLTNESVYCRQLAVWGKRTEDGRLLHARNLDWFDYPGRPLQRNNLVLNVKPDKGIEYLILTWPGLQGALTGANREGLVLGFNKLNYRNGRARIAEPVFFTLKRILRSCSSVKEAIEILQAARPLGNGSILISDAKDREAAVVELIAGHVGVRRSAAPMIGNANHATKEAGLVRGRTGSPDWPACRAANDIKGAISVEAMKSIMADPRVLQDINILSVVFDYSRNRLHLSCGRKNAARGPFTSAELFPKDGWLTTVFP